MMYIESEKAKVTWYNSCGGPLACVYDAEIEVHDGDEIIYINASESSDGVIFTARNVSIFDEFGKETDWANMKPIENIEEFEDYNDTKKSKYSKYYKIAERMIKDLSD